MQNFNNVHRQIATLLWPLIQCNVDSKTFKALPLANKCMSLALPDQIHTFNSNMLPFNRKFVSSHIKISKKLVIVSTISDHTIQPRIIYFRLGFFAFKELIPPSIRNFFKKTVKFSFSHDYENLNAKVLFL